MSTLSPSNLFSKFSTAPTLCQALGQVLATQTSVRPSCWLQVELLAGDFWSLTYTHIIFQ